MAQINEHIDRPVGEHVAKLSERLMAQRAPLFPPDAHNALRRFTSGEGAAVPGVTDTCLRKPSLPGRGRVAGNRIGRPMT